MAGTIFTPIKASVMNSQQIARDLEAILIETALEMDADYEDIVADWSNPPTFTVKIVADRHELSATITTRDLRFLWANEGTGERGGGSAYPIVAVNAPTLAFPALFEPRTAPHSIGNQPGGIGKYGPLRTPVAVEHPGIEPRHFDTDLSDYWQPIFIERLRDYFRRADFLNIGR